MLKKYYIDIMYIMIKHFGLSLYELRRWDLNNVFSLIEKYKEEEKNNHFLQLALAGVDLSKNNEYIEYMKTINKEKEIDMSEMEEAKNLSLKILKGDKDG